MSPCTSSRHLYLIFACLLPVKFLFAITSFFLVQKKNFATALYLYIYKTLCDTWSLAVSSSVFIKLYFPPLWDSVEFSYKYLPWFLASSSYGVLSCNKEKCAWKVIRCSSSSWRCSLSSRKYIWLLGHPVPSIFCNVFWLISCFFCKAAFNFH